MSGKIGIRMAARLRKPLDGTDAQALEGALSQVEQELATSKAKLAEIEGTKILIDKWGLALMEKLGEFLRKTVCGGPLTTVIACTLGGDEEDEGAIPAVWLWATTDETDPVARIRKMAVEKAALQAQLSVLLGVSGDR